jgi:hypothetical protein
MLRGILPVCTRVHAPELFSKDTVAAQWKTKEQELSSDDSPESKGAF